MAADAPVTQTACYLWYEAVSGISQTIQGNYDETYYSITLTEEILAYNTPVLEGYTFLGWKINSQTEVASLNPTGILKDGDIIYSTYADFYLIPEWEENINADNTYVTINKTNLITLANSLRAITGSSNLFSGESLVHEVANFLNENKIFYEVHTASKTGTVTIEHNLGALPDVIGVFCLSGLTSASSSRPSGTSSSGNYTNYASYQLLSANAEKDLEGNYSSSTLYAHPRYYYNSSKSYSYHDDNVLYVSPTSTDTIRISNITETSFSVPYLVSGKKYGVFALIRSN